MPAKHVTPITTPAAQIRTALIAAIEQVGGKQIITTTPPGVAVDVRDITDYGVMADEILGFIFDYLAANTTGATKSAVNAQRAAIGV